jgi:ubiquinone/menaquinone biosynthesis C-methylase UbiE
MSDVREDVRARYADAAIAVKRGTNDSAARQSCCGPECCGAPEVLGPALYADLDISKFPDGAMLASLGCGNPLAVADVNEGETVLDLGSGGGIDVLLSARRVGPTGKVYGLDMTDEMLELAEQNRVEAEVTNVEFLKGFIERIPLPDASVDLVISNCVINLSADKQAVLNEIARILRPGGRVGVSDVVSSDALSQEERARRGSYVGCIAGALSFGEYEDGLRRAGLIDISITPTHSVADEMFSAIVRAIRPRRAHRERGA